jgi:hypothetical protein
VGAPQFLDGRETLPGGEFAPEDPVEDGADQAVAYLLGQPALPRIVI